MTKISESKLRRNQVFSVSLTEMMLILLFFMFLVAKNAIESEAATVDFSGACKVKLEACEADLKKTQAEVMKLTAQLDKFRQWIATLLDSLGLKPLSPADRGFDDDVFSRNWKGGVGKPNCLGNNIYLLELQMEDGFITARKSWPLQRGPLASSIVAAQEVVDAGRVSFSIFEKYAMKISSGMTDCIYSVVVSDLTTRKETYKPQLLSIEKYFRRRVQ